MHVCLQDVFPEFFKRVLALKDGEGQAPLKMHERTAYLLFTINVFQVCTHTLPRRIFLG